MFIDIFQNWKFSGLFSAAWLLGNGSCKQKIKEMLSPLYWRNWDWEGVDQFSQLLLQSFVKSLRKNQNTKEGFQKQSVAWAQSCLLHEETMTHREVFRENTKGNVSGTCFHWAMVLYSGWKQSSHSYWCLWLSSFLEEDKHEWVK